jgi:hypothetical protein
MDYSKWDKLGESDSEEDDSSESTVRISGGEVIDGWNRIKAKTDGIMVNEEYEFAINGYTALLELILTSSALNKIERERFRSDLLLLEISCRLGSACCLIKRSNFSEALRHIGAALLLPELSDVQRSRALYFKAVALCNCDNVPGGGDSAREAFLACDELTALVAKNSIIADKAQVEEYEALRQSLKKKMESKSESNEGKNDLIVKVQHVSTPSVAVQQGGDSIPLKWETLIKTAKQNSSIG